MKKLECTNNLSWIESSTLNTKSEINIFLFIFRIFIFLYDVLWRTTIWALSVSSLQYFRDFTQERRRPAVVQSASYIKKNKKVCYVNYTCENSELNSTFKTCNIWFVFNLFTVWEEKCISVNFYAFYALVRQAFFNFLLIYATDRSTISSDQPEFNSGSAQTSTHFSQTRPLRYM